MGFCRVSLVAEFNEPAVARTAYIEPRITDKTLDRVDTVGGHPNEVCQSVT
jgi:hypothetical protein